MEDDKIVKKKNELIRELIKTKGKVIVRTGSKDEELRIYFYAGKVCGLEYAIKILGSNK
jgi:hypothetical protein